MNAHPFNRRRRTSPRRATSTVEFAIVLPLVVVLLLGAVELGRAIMVQHALQEAAQAGCRVYSVADTTQQDADDMIAAALAEEGITEYSVEYSPEDKASIDTQIEPVTVSVTVQFADVAYFLPDFFSGGAITGASTMPADLED